MNIIPEMILNMPLALVVVAVFIATLMLIFIFCFSLPGVRLLFHLRMVRSQLKSGERYSPADIQDVFEGDDTLKHLWKEFRDTLHEQREEHHGELVTVAWRATTPAASFFNGQSVIDDRLKTEFFKHLPGIFTGLGIIGTFSGLIHGLQSFQVPDDPAKVRASLEALLHGVFEAFIVSACAIGLAMVATLLEKWLLAALYGITEEICAQLDGRFAMGAGEEYLARLVTASEDSSAQSRMLKDSLVGDLKVLLQDMTKQQILAQKVNTETLSKQIISGIEASLQAPLQRIGDVVAQASGDQSAVAADLLKDVMASFSQRLNDLFGGQISGIQELNQKSAQAMQDAVTSLNALVGQMTEQGRQSSDLMAQKMAKAVEEMEYRQVELNEQTRYFVENLNTMISKAQSETSGKLNESITHLGLQMGDMIGALQSQATQAHSEQQRREQDLAERTSGMVSNLGDSVADVVRQMAESTAQMQHSVASLERTTTDALGRLNDGARTLERGATAFAQAGDRVTGTLDRAGALTGKLTEVSGGLTASAHALQTVLTDYRVNRDATAAMLTELRIVVESAKKEASLTHEALERIQSAATKLGQAQKDAETYLDGVSMVLAQAHEKFSDGITRTLDRANVDFHDRLSKAVGLLSSTIQEFETTLADAPAIHR